MQTAVMRVIVDPDGLIPPEKYAAGVRHLQDEGHHVVATAAEHLPDRAREIEFILPEGLVPAAAERLLPLCHQIFGVPASLGVMTYISRGTDDDALGVLRRFGISGEIDRTVRDGEDLVTVRLSRAESAKVSESRLHTAMEAALNVEVSVITSDD